MTRKLKCPKCGDMIAQKRQKYKTWCPKYHCKRAWYLKCMKESIKRHYSIYGNPKKSATQKRTEYTRKLRKRYKNGEKPRGYKHKGKRFTEGRR